MGKTDQFVVVTGCSTGIGYSAASRLTQMGYQVIATVRNPEDIEALKAMGVQHVVLLELASSESVHAAATQINQLCHGVLFALFNNAAYGQPGAVEDLSREALTRQFEVNVFGTHELTRALLPCLLKSPEARIIQNSSVLGFAAMPMRGAYNASKFALEGLTDTLRMELAASSNINVVLIEPGPIDTAFRKNALKALRQNVDMNSSRHATLYQQALARLDSQTSSTPFTLPADAVVDKLVKALTSRRPKARYYVTFPTYLFAFLRHFLPTVWLDKIKASAASA